MIFDAVAGEVGRRRAGVAFLQRIAIIGGMKAPATDRGQDLQHQVETWAKAAVQQGCIERLEDSDEFYASVPGARGAWACGPTPEDAEAELESALVDWALLKLELGADDIPEMGGIRLTVDL